MEIRCNVGGDGNYLSHSWRQILAQKVTRVLELIRQYPDEILVIADVDIQWFRPTQSAILNALENKDIVFQSESISRREANCGFLALRCNKRTEALFELLDEADSQRKTEQQVANELIAQGKMPCSFGILPHTFFNDNLDGRNAPPDEELRLYHSIGTLPTEDKTSIQIKLERHIAMRARVLRSKSVFRSAPDVQSAIGLQRIQVVR
jgi:hypothetical protein